MPPICATPALLTTTSTPPHSRCSHSATACRSASRVTSQVNACDAGAYSRIVAMASSQRAVSRSPMHTRQPSRA